MPTILPKKGIFKDMASITLKNIVKTYEDGVTVIPDLNLEIKDKEFIILVGPSGCGKSTTLRMIAGLEDISEGTLYIGDKPMNDVPPKDRDIAMVFQSYALYPHMSVYKNMAFALKLRKQPKAEIDRKVREAAKALELEPYLNRKPKALSGGQRQRVALGRAMVRNPEVFLLDEPLSNLDAKLRTEMRARIAALHKQLGATFVYVTHDQTEAMTMADRIVVMRDGKILQVDTPDQLYAHPCNQFVAGFIGTPQMNFIPARILKQQSEYYAAFDGYRIRLPQRMQKNPALGAYTDKNVIYGVRAENFHIDPGKALPDGSNAIRLHAELAEMMGADIYIYSALGDTKVIAKVPSFAKVSTDEEVTLYLDPDAPHLFDAESEELICD